MTALTRISGLVLSTALAGGLAVTGLGAGTAQALPITVGQATATGGLAVRSAPTTHARSRASIPKGTKFEIACKVHGTRVGGNDLWYLTVGGETLEWVSARYVANVGKAPVYCPDRRAVGRASATLTKRQGPHTKDASVGRYAKGARFDVVCKVKSQSVDGNSLWYLTRSGGWVSARYVANVGKAPGYCTL